MTASLGNGMIVEKKVFELQHFTTSNGATLKSVRVGWESYGVDHLSGVLRAGSDPRKDGCALAY